MVYSLSPIGCCWEKEAVSEEPCLADSFCLAEEIREGLLRWHVAAKDIPYRRGQRESGQDCVLDLRYTASRKDEES